MCWDEASVGKDEGEISEVEAPSGGDASLGSRDCSAEVTACQDFLRRDSRARVRGKTAPPVGRTTGGLGDLS